MAAAIAAAEPGDRDIADAGARDADLRSRIEMMAGRSPNDAVRRARESARRIERQLDIRPTPLAPARTGAVLALAYPDRIAMRRPEVRRADVSNSQAGRARIRPNGSARRVCAVRGLPDLDGQKPDARIWLAAPLTPQELDASLGGRIVDEDIVAFDRANGGASRGAAAIGVRSCWPTPHFVNPTERAIAAEALLDGASSRSKYAALPWTDEAHRLRARIAALLVWPGRGPDS